MSRWLLALIFCAACGDNFKQAAPDAAPPDTGPDALMCQMGEAACDGECIPVTEDESNCGSCANVCQGGAVCSTAMCKCPSGVVPSLVIPTGFEQFFPVGPLTLTLAPTISISGGGSVNGLVFGHDASIALNTDIDLASVPLGSTPFVAALAGLDVQTFAIDASYVATAGTIKFTKRCETEIQGTLMNATFNGVSGKIVDGTIPMVDPNGCVVHITSMTFHLMTAACP